MILKIKYKLTGKILNNVNDSITGIMWKKVTNLSCSFKNFIYITTLKKNKITQTTKYT